MSNLFRWVKASERLPETNGDIIWRRIGTTNLVGHNYKNGKFYKSHIADGYFDNIEWLEEVPVPHSETSYKKLIEKIHNHLVTVMPTGGVHAFDIIKAVNAHLKWLDELSEKESETSGNKMPVKFEQHESEWIAWIEHPLFKGFVATGITKAEAWQELMKSVQVHFAFSSNISAQDLKELESETADEPSVATVVESSNVADPIKKESETSEGKEDLVLPKLKPLKVNWREHATRYLTNALWLNLTKTNEVLGYFSQYFDSKSEGKQGEE